MKNLDQEKATWLSLNEPRLILPPPFSAAAEKEQFDEAMRLLQEMNPSYYFERSGYSSVCEFFDEASDDYDSDTRNPYWSFAHDILKFILRQFIADHFAEGQKIRLFDAGAGTANWSTFVLSLNERISGTLFDMNTRMLKVAHPKVTELRSNAVRIIEGNLEVLTDFPSDPSNLVLCMHNVIGMGRDTNLILSNLYQYLEEGGLAFIMTTNAYHAFNFTKKLRGDREALRVVSDGTVKFKDDMPEMFCYTPEEFKNILKAAGFEHVTVLGFPVTVYPSIKDTKLQEMNTTDQQLKDPHKRTALLNLEKRLCLDPNLAYRAGSSLIAVCKKAPK